MSEKAASVSSELCLVNCVQFSFLQFVNVCLFCCLYLVGV